MIEILQCNLNHSWDALDMLKQHLLEYKIDICAISEPPPRIVSSADWHTSLDERAAIHFSSRYSCRLIGRTQNSVVVATTSDLYVVSCYILPNASLREFEEFIDD